MSMDEDLFDVGENDDDMLGEDMENYDMDVDDDNGNGDNNDEGNEDANDEDNDDNDEENDDNDEENDENDEENEDNDDENDEDEDGDEDDEDDDDETQESTSAKPSGNTDSGNANDAEMGAETRSNDAQTKETQPENGKATGAHSNGDSSTNVDTYTSGSLRERVLESIRKATEFDIVPTVAIPYAQQCHALAVSEGPKWILTGGEDGFIRKYDFTASIEGKAPLTVAQKHNLMDSITKAGVIGSYWENEQPQTRKQILQANPKIKESDFSSGSVAYEPQVNPVYSLDVERNGFWCLSGLLSGGISLYTMIYNEGAIHHYFRHNTNKNGEQTIDTGHLDAVSVLRLNREQDRFLSGSWDKTIREWDLNTGKVVNLFKGSTGQISTIRYRPEGLTDITFKNDGEGQNPSDVDSLFGDSDEEDNNNVSKESIKTDTSKNKQATSNNIFMSSSIDGTINIWDARVSGKSAVLKLGVPENAPPWCMTASWSNDGDKVYVGRRNSTVEEISLRMPHARGVGNTKSPNVLKRLLFPKISGPVTALSTMPNDNFLLCGSNDNIRLYNLGLYHEFALESTTSKKRATPFFVIPGHNGGALSNLHVDDTGRFMISTSGNRGWGHSSYADVVLVYSIDCEGMP